MFHSSSKTITNVHVIDPTNVGDLLSSPLKYFDFPEYDCIAQDIRTLNSENLNNTHIIIGGGGLLFERFLPKIQNICAAKGVGKKIFWGVGQQRYSSNLDILRFPFDYLPYLIESDLVGIRDDQTSYPWVPCVSCMHPAFDKPRSPQREFVIFSHKKFQVNLPGIPRMTNEITDFDAVLDFLGSGETILTSSFHGAYWGVLLGRRVLAFPFSSKFMTMRHQPTLFPIERWTKMQWQLSFLGRVLYTQKCEGENHTCNTSKWRKYAAQTITYPESLEECRARNRWFYHQVMEELAA